jgi:carboxymethylenebutenolidase
VVGFSLGASYALDLSINAPEHIRSVVVYYGTGGGDFGRSKAAYLGHFAENDPFEPTEGVQALEKMLKDAGRTTSFFTYPGTGHWFFEQDRPEHDEEAAELAWQRTLDFLRQHLPTT